MTSLNSSPFRLRYGRGRVLEPFLNRVGGERRVQQIIWVSPWMTHLAYQTGTTNTLLRRIDADGSQVTIVTRTPDDGPHRQFIQDVCRLRNAEVFYLDDLHAKYYVCHTPHGSYAVVGSPNLYRWTAKSYEVGVTIEARGQGESLISQLETITFDLKTTRTRTVRKLRGKGPTQ